MSRVWQLFVLVPLLIAYKLSDVYKEMVNGKDRGGYIVCDVFPDLRKKEQFTELFDDNIKFIITNSLDIKSGMNELIEFLETIEDQHSLRQTRTRMGFDFDTNFKPNHDTLCPLDHESWPEHQNIGLLPPPKPIGWGERYNKKWFIWSTTEIKKDGLNEVDVKEFNERTPSTIFQRSLNKDAECIFGESYKTVSKISYKEYPFPTDVVYEGFGPKTKELIDAGCGYAGLERTDVVQYFVKLMNGSHFLNKIAVIKRTKIIEIAKEHKQDLKQSKNHIIHRDHEALESNIAKILEMISEKVAISLDEVKRIIVFHMLLSKQEKKTVRSYEKQVKQERMRQKKKRIRCGVSGLPFMDMYRKALNRNELNDEKEQRNEPNDAQRDNPKEDEVVSEQKNAQSDDDEDLDVHEEQSEGGDEEENELRINMEFEMRQEEQIDPVGPLDEALFEAEAADDKVYCVCRKKYSEGDQMIGCEECIEYYHIKCIGITPEEFNFYCESDDAWYCKNCVL